MATGPIDWGDIPTWVTAAAAFLALVVATFGGWVTYRQFRQQTDVLMGEVERNKRRDELLDGQLQELQERAEDRRRDQAEMVEVIWENQPVMGRTWGIVTNKSKRPISNVQTRIIIWVSGGTRWESPGPWRERPEHTAKLLVESHNELGYVLPVILAGHTAFREFELLNGPGYDTQLVVRFNDDADRRWQLDGQMHLESAPDHQW